MWPRGFCCHCWWQWLSPCRLNWCLQICSGCTFFPLLGSSSWWWVADETDRSRHWCLCFHHAVAYQASDTFWAQKNSVTSCFHLHSIQSFNTCCLELQDEKIKHKDVEVRILWSTECYNSFQWLCNAWCVARVVTAGQRECAQSLKTPWLVFTVGPPFFWVSTSNSPRMQGVVLHVFKSAPCNSNYVANQPQTVQWIKPALYPFMSCGHVTFQSHCPKGLIQKY